MAVHGLATFRAWRAVGLSGAGFDSGGVEPLGEAALFLELPALAFELAFQKIGAWFTALSMEFAASSASALETKADKPARPVRRTLPD